MMCNGISYCVQIICVRSFVMWQNVFANERAGVLLYLSLTASDYSNDDADAGNEDDAQLRARVRARLAT